jgi:hypothetical protein
VHQMAWQLRQLSKAKNTWTAQGQLVAVLRAEYAPGALADPENPFIVGPEGVALLGQMVAQDGLLLREVLRVTIENGPEVSRDEVAKLFGVAVDRAVEAAKTLGVSQPARRKAREFQKHIEQTLKRAREKEGSKGPGVLEHRVSPRLEWLTDLGYLSKEGLPANGFVYRVTASAKDLLDQLDHFAGGETAADRIAIREWNESPVWADLRKLTPAHTGPAAFFSAYRAMQRTIGPAPLREVTFVSALLRRGSAEEAAQGIAQLAQQTDGITLSGGPYSRDPQNIYMTDSALEHCPGG